MNHVMISGVLKQDPMIIQTAVQQTQVALQIAVLESRSTVKITLYDGMAERVRDYFKTGDSIRIYGQLSQKVVQGEWRWDIDWQQLQKPDYRDADYVA